MSRSWDEDFQSHFPALAHVASELQLEQALAKAFRYDLIIVAPLAISSSLVTFRQLRRLRQALTTPGSLFAIVENRLDLTACARDLRRITDHAGGGLLKFRWWLRHAGFERTAEFLAMPNLSSVEEFVLSGSRELALPVGIPPIVRIVHKLRLLPLVHDGAAYMASASNAGPQLLLHTLATELRRRDPYVDCLELQRFDLRARGALVLLLKVRRSQQRIVCRLTTDDITDRIVGRNSECLTFIIDAPGVSQQVKSALPSPLGIVSLPHAKAYLERAIPGSIGWKIASSGRMERTLRIGLFTFITALGKDTAREAVVDEPLLQELLEPPRSQPVNASVAEPYRTLRDRLRERVLGKRRITVWAHGDFGYGNVIANPRTGGLNGVIDWDQARTDLAGVDLLNFLVQRERTLHGSSLPVALNDIGHRFIRESWKGLDPRIPYETRFDIITEARSELVAWVSLRFAQRALTYPSLFGMARDETSTILKWATAILE